MEAVLASESRHRDIPPFQMPALHLTQGGRLLFVRPVNRTLGRLPHTREFPVSRLTRADSSTGAMSFAQAASQPAAFLLFAVVCPSAVAS